MQDTLKLVFVFVSIVVTHYVHPGYAQPFELAYTLREGESQIGMYRACAAWGDIGGDGDLDIILSGNQMESFESTYLLRQVGSFGSEKIGLPDVQFGSMDLGDLDQDGLLDILVTGRLYNARPMAGVYKATTDSETPMRTTFEIEQSFSGLEPVERGDAVWGDYDNDGDLDILLTGVARNDFISKIYRNNGLLGPMSARSGFTEMDTGLMGVGESSVLWADFDNDGDLDILLTGNSLRGFVTLVYRNDGPATGDAWVFTEIQPGIPGLAHGDVAAADYDADGDADLILTGCLNNNCSQSLTAIYRNTRMDEGSIVFEPVDQTFTGVFRSSVSWGDYDNDGDLDFLLTGEDSAAPGAAQSTVFRNDDGVFNDAEVGLPAVTAGVGALGDYDRDGRLDILVTGYSYEEERFIVEIFRNAGVGHNSRPGAPSNIEVTNLDENSVLISWDPGSDRETPASGLTYNLRVCTATFDGPYCTGDVVPSLALRNIDARDASRQIVRHGNTGSNTSWVLDRLAPGDTYLISLQSIDQGYLGSLFSPEVVHTMPGDNDNFLASLSVTDEISTTTVYFGTNMLASDDYETTFDYLAAPSPAGNTFDARFINNGYELIKDIRATNQDSIVWNVFARPWYNNRLTFTWNPDVLPDNGSVRLRDAIFFGFFVDVDMKQTTTAHIDRYLTRFDVVYELNPTSGQIATSVPETPGSFKLYGNYPNPAKTHTDILMDVPARTEVCVDVFDVLGRQVGHQPWQTQEEGRNRSLRINTETLLSGAYFYRLRFRKEFRDYRETTGRFIVVSD